MVCPCIMVTYLLSLAVFLVIITAAQAQFGGCYTNQDCAGAALGPASAEDCCVNSAGTYFSNGGDCLICIVYGWGAASFTKLENQLPNEVPLAYFKGPGGFLFVDIVDSGEGTAIRDSDFTQNDDRVSLSVNADATTSVTFRPDSIALESDETIVFDLILVGVSGGGINRDDFDESLPNVFFQRRTTLFIQDSTELVFRLREADEAENEDNGYFEIVVEVANQRDLATPISLLLTPRVAEEGFMPEPRFLPFARANTHIGRTDFITDPIRLDFPVGRIRELSAFVPIVDDDINEVLEFFAVDLSFADPSSVPSAVTIGGSGVIRLDIVDNDDIFIGFQLPNTTYPEEEQTHQVTLIKGAGNVTEQIIFAIVNLVETVPPGTSFDTATPSDDAAGIDNDLAFGGVTNSMFLSFAPDSNEITVSFTIFSDELPENTEAAQLVLEAPTEETQPGVQPPRFEPLPELLKFFIIILDDDRFRLGFEMISYTVTEGIGFQEVCLRLFEPPNDTQVTGTFFVAVETVADTADGNDYTATSGFDALATFSNDQRRSCVNIMITDDITIENEERFSLQLASAPGFDLPDDFVLSPDTSEIIISPNDGVTVGFIDAPYSVGEEQGVVVFIVGVTNGLVLEGPAELTFSIVNNSNGELLATAGVDFIAIYDVQIILIDGNQRVEIAVNISDDKVFEGNESFTGVLTLISGMKVAVDVPSATVTIIDDEKPPEDSTGGIVGGVVGTVAVLCIVTPLVILTVLLVVRRRQSDPSRTTERQDSSNWMPAENDHDYEEVDELQTKVIKRAISVPVATKESIPLNVCEAYSTNSTQ